MINRYLQGFMPMIHQTKAGKDVIIVIAICFGWFILTSILAATSALPERSFSDSSFLGLIIFEVIFAAAAIMYLRAHGYDLAHLIPIPSPKGCLIGFVLFMVASLISLLIKIVLEKFHSGIQPIETMVASATISFIPLVVASIVNGLYEEIFLIGYLQRTLEGVNTVFAISISLTVRLLYHLYQGPVAAFSLIGYGLVLSLFFLKKRELWPIVFAHILTDFLGFASAKF